LKNKELKPPKSPEGALANPPCTLIEIFLSNQTLKISRPCVKLSLPFGEVWRGLILS